MTEQVGREVEQPTEPVEAELSRQYVKLCDLRDFDDPAITSRIDDIVPGLEASERLHRKKWEYAMLTLFLEDSGLLRDDTRILSVGAGHETGVVLAREPGGQGGRDRHLRRGQLQRAGGGSNDAQ